MMRSLSSAASREHDDRDARQWSCRRAAPADLETAHAGQHDVEDRRGRPVAAGAGQRLVARRGDVRAPDRRVRSSGRSDRRCRDRLRRRVCPRRRHYPMRHPPSPWLPPSRPALQRTSQRDTSGAPKTARSGHRRRADRRRRGNRQHPRPDDLAGDAPAHRRQAPRRRRRRRWRR